MLKDSLAATLAKSQPEKKIFKACFDLFFSLDDSLDTDKGGRIPSSGATDGEDSPRTRDGPGR
jgi:uncharacterized protein with von Willebrand factor type A (vWA) domain